MLDGLHEDLNQIQQKPYIENLDSNGRPDEVVSREQWENFKKRNLSVIVDLFYGQLKSRVECRTCGNTNVTFDPFLTLSVPIPKKVHL
jgi:ubiquitin C-terminal hydrolase